MDFNAQKALVNQAFDNCLELLGKNPSIEELDQCIDSYQKQLSDPLLIHQLIIFRAEIEDLIR